MDPVKKILDTEDCEHCKYFDRDEALFVNACKRSPNPCKFVRRKK